MNSRISIRPPTRSDRDAFIARALASEQMHRSWTKALRTPEKFRHYIQQMRRPENHSFLVCPRDTDETVGVINVTNIVLGLFRSAYVGFCAVACGDGQGFMREGLQAVIRPSF